jgi:hypothetical protein
MMVRRKREVYLAIQSVALALSLHLFFVGAISQQSRPSRTAVTKLTLVASAESDAASGTVLLKWALKNTSDTKVMVGNVNFFIDHKVTVRDQNNRTVALTEKGQEASTASYFTMNRRTIILGPGEELRNELQISDFYNMKAKGIYTIVLERRVSTSDGKGFTTIRSNVVKIQVRKP